MGKFSKTTAKRCLILNLIDGIKGNRFVVFGRAGMDMFADPIGTKSELANTFKSDLGGSSANICAGLCKLGSSIPCYICF
jgi:5-dehydro-2-deoxygluconokinase